MQYIHEGKKKKKSVCVLTDVIRYKRNNGWRDMTATWPGAAQNFGGEASVSCFAADLFS